jgi:hypothetical protein
MQKNNADELRRKARQYRERADREVREPVITEAFYQIGASLERRALLCETAVLEAAFPQRDRGWSRNAYGLGVRRPPEHS